MLGLLLIYYIGKSFYTLAEKNNKNNWTFAILGVVIYYAGTFIGGIILVLLLDSLTDINVDGMNNILLSLIALPFGLLTWRGLHTFLKNKWEKVAISSNSELLDDELIQRFN